MSPRRGSDPAFSVLVYADPPYLLRTRSDRQYREKLDDAGHEELLRVLLDHPGPVMLSGYDSELYKDILAGWDQLQRPAQAANGALRTKCLWVNFWGRPEFCVNGQILLERFHCDHIESYFV